MKRKYVIDHNDGETSSYEMEVTANQLNNHKIKMFFDKDSASWTDLVRGKICAELKDHGNGVKIKFPSHHNKKDHKISVDYSEILELYLLLDFYFKGSDILNIVPNIKKYIEVD